MSAARRRPFLLLPIVSALVLLLAVPALGRTTPAPVSDPADGAELDAPPASVTFTFPEPLLGPGYVSVVVDGHPVTLPAGDPIVEGERMVADLSGADAEGRDWLVAYRVAAEGGESLEGATRFSVPSAEVNDAPIAVADDEQGLWSSPGAWLAAAGIVLVLGLVLLRVFGRRRERA